MTTQEKQVIYSILIRLIDDGAALSPTERRDLLNQLYQTNCNMNLDEILHTTQNNRKLRIKRGSTLENDTYTGLAGEITMDTTNNTLCVHDGQTPGGTPLAKQSEISNLQGGLSMLIPGKTSENITIGASGSIYTPTKNGWIQASCTASNGTWVRMTNTTRDMSIFSGWNGAANEINTNMYVVAGDNVRLEYNGAYTFKLILPAAYDNE